MEQLDSSLFDAFTWRGGNPRDLFGISCHSGELIKSAHRLRQYAIGYCPAEQLVCRPKPDHVAIMFEKDGRRSWFHIRNEEFERIFHDH